MRSDPEKAKAWRARSKPLKRTGFKKVRDDSAAGSLQPRKRLAAKGARQRRLQPAITEAYNEVDRRSGGKCEAGIPGRCQGIGRDHHHRGKQSVWPELKASAANIVLVCRPCHDWIDANQQAASERPFPLHLWRNVENEILMGVRDVD